jgi:hypothetical protein
MTYFCCATRRRAEVRTSPFNGIDFLEVVDRDAPSPSLRQRLLELHLLDDATGLGLGPDNVVVEGGERVRGIEVVSAVVDGTQTNLVNIQVDRRGDSTPYRLRLRRSALDQRPPEGVDPRLAAVDFSFKVECASDFDCAPRLDCPPEAETPPPIDYLAKDYETIRRLMLDRMAVLVPDWHERSPADLGVTLVELLAWVADQLSYAQDAVHTEAYLGHARLRPSLRRLARLVDYRLNDGRNARTFVQIRVSGDARPLAPDMVPVLPAGTAVTSRVAEAGARLADAAALARAEIVFETLHDVEALIEAHEAMSFHTWSDRRCALPRGATAATLAGHFPELRAGEVLVFEEVKGPRTGHPGDADPAHRQAVRLVEVRAFADDASPLEDPLTGAAVTEISWHGDDALTAPVCVSSRTDPAFGASRVEDVSVARGNIVLADHGRTIAGEDLGAVPASRLAWAAERAGDPCAEAAPRPIPARFAPRLAEGPLTHAAAFVADAPAAATLDPAGGDVLPAVTLTGQRGAETTAWTTAVDLLASDAFAARFVAEIENDGGARLRFGDGARGRRPEPGTAFTARYRVGNGTAGQVGADTLVHVRSDLGSIVAVRNLLPGRGGRDPASADAVRERAPHAFRTQERAVTREDWADVARRYPAVQHARASWRHTGSWHTVFVAVDREGGEPFEAAGRRDFAGFLERFRLAGRDLEIARPRWVALDLRLRVCVARGYFRGDVGAAVSRLFSTATLANGTTGLFHPDRFTFGATVWLSPFVAAAQNVAGVDSVVVLTFERLGDDATSGIAAGRLTFAENEIPRLDDDPDHPERGRFRLELMGGA